MLESADVLSEIREREHLPVIFKSSVVKDNRSALENYRGPGLEEGLRLLERVRNESGLPVLTDIHEPAHAAVAASVVDVLQIPAYLCMQTSLAVAAAGTGLPVNVKRGQFLAPARMSLPVAKLQEAGCEQILVTERGYTFGYDDLIVDPRSFPILRSLGRPVLFDVTHSIRRYGVPSGDPTGASREFLGVLARAAVAAGVDGLFIEVHPVPEEARCDAASQLRAADLAEFLKPLLEIHELVRGYTRGAIDTT